MSAAKGKGGSASHRYRPASEYDDATLAHKREYWRNKKREQRARLSERRAKPAQARQRGAGPHLSNPVGVNSCLSVSFAASSSSFKNSESYSCDFQSEHTVGGSSRGASESQKGKWLQTSNLDSFLPTLPASCSLSSRGSGGDSVSQPATVGAVCRAVTSATSSRTPPSSSASVPPVRGTTTLNGSSTKTAPQPCVSMQRISVPQTQDKAQTSPPIQPRLSPTNTTAGMITVSPACGPVPVKTEGGTGSPTPGSGANRGLVTTPRAKGVGNAQPPPESEEEKAAKRRELWRIKKRIQRAKLAAQITEGRERTQGAGNTFQRTTTPAGLAGGLALQNLQRSQSFLKGANQKQQRATRPKTLLPSTRIPCEEQRSRAAALRNLQTNQVKLESPTGNDIMHSRFTVDRNLAKKPLDSLRRLPGYVHVSGVTRMMTRCKTPRQKFMEVQKNLINLRNIRCKSPFVGSVFGSRGMPAIDPNDTPEQVVAKRREYWRVKKREQRAKLSLEMKARLKEKDSLMRRVKRYQTILEEIRRARALSHPTRTSLSHDSETIGGFIKEDGTLSTNLPHISLHLDAQDNTEERHLVSKNLHNTRPRRICPARRNQPPPPARPFVKVVPPLPGRSCSRSSALLSLRTHPQPQSTAVPHPHSSVVQTCGQLTLRHPPTPQSALPGGTAAGSAPGGCVMKMAVLSSTPSLAALSLDPGLTEEERMAKKREYWRIKKREQRAARAVRLKQGVLQARALAALQRRRAQNQKIVAVPSVRLTLPPLTRNTQPLPNNSNVLVGPQVKEVKSEVESLPVEDLSDFNPPPEPDLGPDVKPLMSPAPPTAPQLESDPSLSVDSQATTLLAVASMKKLLEESLSTVTESKAQQTDIKLETSDGDSERDKEPLLSPLLFEKDDMAPIIADLTAQIKSCQPEDGEDLIQDDLVGPKFSTSPLGVSPPPPPLLPPPSDQLPSSTSEHSSQTPCNFIFSPSMDGFDGSSSPQRIQSLHFKEEEDQTCSSPEPPKPDPELDQVTSQSPNQPDRPKQDQVGPQKDGSLPRAPGPLSSLQRKREYWKLMKRQQRARLKARQTDRKEESSRWIVHRNLQAPGPIVIKPRPPPPPTRSIPAVLVLSPTPRETRRSLESLQVRPAVTSTPLNKQGVERCVAPPPDHWTSGRSEPTASPPTLKPPDNPLTSINLQPIEPPGLPPDAVLSPIKIPCAPPRQSPTHGSPSPTRLLPLSSMIPPKPIPGESQEDFLRRKREYWRIKKKEQRARKKGVAPGKVSISSRPAPPTQDLHTQWGNTPEESQPPVSVSMDSDPSSFSYSDYTAPVEDESELLFADFKNEHNEEEEEEEEAAVSDVVWRNRYLMDYDMLNQLLVCMVCGELQYSHSLEGVRNHIDEAHPHTLTLDTSEKTRILEAWDEQVSQRERFFTNQLQQHSGALAEANRN